MTIHLYGDSFIVFLRVDEKQGEVIILSRKGRKLMLTTQSSELQATQARVDSPFGVQFLHVPQVKPANAASSMATKDCQETSRDGTTDMDCIDD